MFQFIAVHCNEIPFTADKQKMFKNMTNSYVLCTNVHDTLGTHPCAVTLKGCTTV